MKETIIYKSVVAIGGFNPTILTPDFLRDCCEFRSDHKPAGQTTPVLAEIRFGNVQFRMELNKFQIVLEGAAGFDETFPLEVMIRYLEILKYTPLHLLGVNLNTTLYNVSMPKMLGLFGNPFKIGEHLQINPSAVSVAAKRTDGADLVLNEVLIVHRIDEYIKNNIRIELDMQSASLNINNNFEVDGLDKDRVRIRQLMERHSEFLKYNRELNALLGGQ
jgi:hypothetical protein